MKEVIMKRFLFWMVLIVGIVAMISSCKKDDDAAATASTPCGGNTAISSCSGTPSGSITGIDNQTLTGVFSVYHYFGIIGTSGFDNVTDCISNADSLASMTAIIGSPTGAQGLIMNYAVTSSSTIADRVIWYSDTSCSTEMAEYIIGLTDVAVVDNVTGLTTSVGSNTYSSTATKVTYNKSCIGMKGSNAAGVTWLKTFLGSAAVNPVVGTSHACSITSSPRYALMHLDNDTFGGSSYGGMGLYWEESSSAQPTAWSSGTDTLQFLP
jgi:hypothetical protein